MAGSLRRANNTQFLFLGAFLEGKGGEEGHRLLAVVEVSAT